MAVNNHISEDGKTLTISITGRFDISTFKEFGDAYKDHLDSASKCVIDLAEVEFMDSSGIGVLVFFKQYLGGGARVVLAAVHPGVVTILKLTHLDKVFDIFATTEEVLQEDLQAG